MGSLDTLNQTSGQPLWLLPDLELLVCFLYCVFLSGTAAGICSGLSLTGTPCVHGTVRLVFSPAVLPQGRTDVLTQMFYWETRLRHPVIKRITVNCVNFCLVVDQELQQSSPFQCEEKWKRSHRVMVSRCEEEDDKGNLDNRQEGEPQQEDVDEGILSGPWHFQLEGVKAESEEPSFFCCRLEAVCACVDLSVCVCVRALAS